MNIATDIGGRWQRLRALTHDTHDTLDRRIMGARAFESRERYGLFVLVQRAFHRDVDALYSNASLDALLPDLAGRRRLPLIEQDVDDLGLAPPADNGSPVFDVQADIPSALGWLYVAEGSNLGAAFLLKEAERLGLSETFGARHLAPSPAGRGIHWRTFTAALDAVELTAPEETRLVAGAESAFRRVHDLVERSLIA
ncbi:biliverdin-producing heme oxygenase [Flaviflagellibacter deserti]|uniref:Biliverdin-producing heme oxygenase n=1 Tax=Flaviflagellibacter deserti TaxID=2267266 RepID=A0ABV9Z3I6_9HYPH